MTPPAISPVVRRALVPEKNVSDLQLLRKERLRAVPTPTQEFPSRGHGHSDGPADRVRGRHGRNCP